MPHFDTQTGRALPGAAAAIAALATVAMLLVSSSAAAPQVAPRNTAEPRISGTARVGEVLRTTRGSWTGTEPIEYDFRWFRCEGRGAPNASDCQRITNASNATYVLRQADAGFRIRSQVVATNEDGSATATSNPTGVVQSARPVNTREPSISGSAVVGSRLTANRGEWVGNTPITYAFQWLRCNPAGQVCAEITDSTDNTYLVAAPDVNRTLRVRVTNRDARPVRGAMVFMRATPRVVQGQTLATRNDGWTTLTLVPNRLFPQPRNGFNVQFFIKAFRSGDPALGGIAGYRLVPVGVARRWAGREGGGPGAPPFSPPPPAPSG